MSEPAGWYGNPDGTETQRYWDGASWTHDVRPLPGAPGFDPGQTEAVGVGPAPLAAEAAPAIPAASPSGSVSELIAVLFDFGMNRSISPALAKTGYRFGAIVILVVFALLLVLGLQGGGVAAIISLVLYPMLALLLLLALRLVCQRVVDAGQVDNTQVG
jgi:hypothetical protein